MASEPRGVSAPRKKKEKKKKKKKQQRFEGERTRTKKPKKRQRTNDRGVLNYPVFKKGAAPPIGGGVPSSTQGGEIDPRGK